MRGRCASGRSFSVGVLVPELNDSYATQVLAGVEEFLIEEGLLLPDRQPSAQSPT